jgi:hypothetical protein
VRLVFGDAVSVRVTSVMQIEPQSGKVVAQVLLGVYGCEHMPCSHDCTSEACLAQGGAGGRGSGAGGVCITGGPAHALSSIGSLKRAQQNCVVCVPRLQVGPARLSLTDTGLPPLPPQTDDVNNWLRLPWALSLLLGLTVPLTATLFKPW